MSVPLPITNLQNYDDQVVQINDLLYKYNILLFNPDLDVVRIKQSAIKTLFLEDSLDNFYHTGYLIYDNKFDVIESLNSLQSNFYSTPSLMDGTQRGTGSKGYRYRGDARDFLLIDIMPEVAPGTIRKGNTNEKDQRIFNLRFTFSIYDTEDIRGDKLNEKYKKLYFHDSTYQIMTEKEVYFTTSDYIEEKDVIRLNNQSRGIDTGIAIQNLIKKTFNPEEGYNLKFSDKWDRGGSSIFYSSPAQYKAIDDLNYLLSFHVSSPESDYDNCYLRLDRYTDEWKLESFKDLFKTAFLNSPSLSQFGLSESSGPGLVESFFLGMPMDESTTPDVQTRIPDFAGNMITYNDSSVLNRYEFTNISGKDSQKEIVSHLVHSHNFNTNTFRIDFQNNSLDTASQTYYNNYVKNLKGSGGNAPASNLALNQYRTKQQNIKNVFTISSESQTQRYSFGRNEILYSSLFLNNCIKFRTKGVTSRQAGQFISIQRHNTVPDNYFDDKNLGIYMIIRCEHVFVDQKYFNEIFAVKTYNYKDPKFTSQTL